TSGNPALLGWILLAKSTTASAAGEIEVALATARESVAVLRGPIRTLPAAWSAHTLATAVASTDPAAAERALVSSCGPDLHALPQPLRSTAFGLLSRCRLALDHPTAADAVAAAHRCAEESGLASARAAADIADAALSLHRGQPHRAGELALAAADAAGSVGAVVKAASARELAGRALAEAGATEHAIAELRRAAGEFDQCGAPRRAAAVERRLRALGDRGRRRSRPGTGAAGVESLTGRELQVARLIVDRRTNAEIGAELFLSGKTVETHVHNVLRKLDVTSRVEVARAVERHERERPLP
ncbi:MAG TPA: LuxR C-terminal-related transcriptional regulator, partial [Pseudonocardia sp.]|nr:LuxR C-terminal-related transcriptional regulator [Pseudonocardia sp.]